MSVTREERDRGERLRAFVKAMDGKPVAYGVDDCSTWPLQWVVNETSIEPPPLPPCESREDAEAMIATAGGLVPLWEPVVRSLRLNELSTEDVPPVGSVGIIETSHFGQVGVIFAFGTVACWRHEQGVRLFGVRQKTILKVWAVPCAG